MRRTRVVVQPKSLEVGEARQMVDFRKVGNFILTQVDFTQALARTQVLEGGHVVDGEGEYFEVRQAGEDAKVVDFATPKIHIFDGLEVF